MCVAQSSRIRYYVLKLVFLEFLPFEVTAWLFPQIRGHSNRFVLGNFCYNNFDKLFNKFQYEISNFDEFI